MTWGVNQTIATIPTIEILLSTMYGDVYIVESKISRVGIRHRGTQACWGLRAQLQGTFRRSDASVIVTDHPAGKKAKGSRFIWRVGGHRKYSYRYHNPN